MFLLFGIMEDEKNRMFFLKSQRYCFISLKQGAISSVDFRGIKSVHCLFKSDAIYYHLKKEREKYCLIFGKQKNTYEIDFSNQKKKERKKRKIKSEKSLAKTIAEEEVRSQRGRLNASR